MGKFDYEEGDLTFVDCFYCKHWDAYEGRRCAAFPFGIPDAIILMEVDHHDPHPDDNGIQFEASDWTST